MKLCVFFLAFRYRMTTLYPSKTKRGDLFLSLSLIWTKRNSKISCFPRANFQKLKIWYCNTLFHQCIINFSWFWVILFLPNGIILYRKTITLCAKNLLLNYQSTLL